MSTLTRSFTLVFAATVMLVGLPALAAAQHYMVSPASCQPAGSDDSPQTIAQSASRLQLINGAWAFRPGQSGSAELACAINFSGAQGDWSAMQLWYRDGYAANNSDSGFVEADLMKRDRDAAGADLLMWVASNIGTDEYGFIHVANPPAGPDNFDLYYVRVRMWRGNTTHELAFVGFEIRF